MKICFCFQNLRNFFQINAVHICGKNFFFKKKTKWKKFVCRFVGWITRIVAIFAKTWLVNSKKRNYVVLSTSNVFNVKKVCKKIWISKTEIKNDTGLQNIRSNKIINNFDKLWHIKNEIYFLNCCGANF